MKSRETFFTTIIIILAAVFPLMLAAQTISGAGATFPYPVYSQWAYKYNQITGVQENYQSIGSGGGIRQIKAKTVGFGASDAPLEPAELDEAGLLQFPMIIGGVVPVINVKGIKAGELKLDAELLAEIFVGKVNGWDDAKIKALNPDLKLPSRNITVVHRADGSGTTWIFTQYLSEVSTLWRKAVGAGKAVSWTTGVGGKGNEGVASYVQRINGAIGYVEYAYALQNKMSHVLLKNREGNFVTPTMETFSAAAEGADWANAPGFYMILVNQPGTESWPITGASFILLYKNQNDKDQALTMLNFFDWSYRHGKQIAIDLHYVPIPDSVVDIIKRTWSKEIKFDGKAIWQ